MAGPAGADRLIGFGPVARRDVNETRILIGSGENMTGDAPRHAKI
ncbi:hypothetical protein [Methylobacterium durans]|nr:hypothetical protein [Methylobacterium durans]